MPASYFILSLFFFNAFSIVLSFQAFIHLYIYISARAHVLNARHGLGLLTRKTINLVVAQCIGILHVHIAVGTLSKCEQWCGLYVSAQFLMSNKNPEMAKKWTRMKKKKKNIIIAWVQRVLLILTLLTHWCFTTWFITAGCTCVWQFFYSFPKSKRKKKKRNIKVKKYF